ncbi:hypothetical protein IL306_005481 [Fusarium sp. DS 682]|nr:hypothetical protein IL306_005481 [Fusarium sp. DS 682]
MSPSPQAPIIIGVGEIRQKSFTLENTLEPAELILSAIRDAAKDTSVDAINHVDSISVVPPWSWTYDDLPKLLAQKLGVEPSHLELSSHGGHTPALLCDAAAARVTAGEAKMAVVTGGEALASLWERANYFSSPAIEYSIDKALKSAALTKNEIDCFDFYSCFPIVPKIACKHVGLNVQKPNKPITLLGGLTSFGGAGNNYSLHSIAEMTRVIRSRKHQNGLVLANGGVLSWQHALCLSAQPRRDSSSYQKKEILDNGNVSQGPAFTAKAQGEAIIEVCEMFQYLLLSNEMQTYTVDYDRKGPKLGQVVGRLVENGHRFIANHGDEHTLTTLASTEGEPIGMKGQVEMAADGRNLFTLKPSARL